MLSLIIKNQEKSISYVMIFLDVYVNMFLTFLAIKNSSFKTRKEYGVCTKFFGSDKLNFRFAENTNKITTKTDQNF